MVKRHSRKNPRQHDLVAVRWQHLHSLHDWRVHELTNTGLRKLEWTYSLQGSRRGSLIPCVRSMPPLGYCHYCQSGRGRGRVGVRHPRVASSAVHRSREWWFRAELRAGRCAKNPTDPRNCGHRRFVRDVLRSNSRVPQVSMVAGVGPVDRRRVSIHGVCRFPQTAAPLFYVRRQ